MKRVWFGIPVLFLLMNSLAGSVRSAEKDSEETLKAMALKLNEITGESVMTGHLRQFLKDEATTKKLIAVAVKLVKENETALNYNAAFVLGRAAQLLKDVDSAQIFFKICIDDAFKLQSSLKVVQVYDSLIDLYFLNNKYDEAIKACQDFLDIRAEKNDSQINQVKPFIMERLIQSLAKNGKFEDAKKLNEKLIDADDGGWYFLQLKAWILREEGKLQDSVDGYLEVIEKLKKNREMPAPRRDTMVSRIRYLVSGIYVDMKKIDKAAELLQALVKSEPENATYYNDLGFIWADHDMNFDEAEKMIRKAIELDRKDRKKDEELTPEEDKDNPAYLDSLGWVLYKKKEYKEAKKYLEEAIKEKEGQHIEILDHLADVHIALNEKAEAIKIWKKCLDQETSSKRDKERREEVEMKLKKAEGK